MKIPKKRQLIIISFLYISYDPNLIDINKIYTLIKKNDVEINVLINLGLKLNSITY